METHFFPHEKRGTEAMNVINILPGYSVILCHDHWKPYYKYDCTHALYNAHHLRELTWANEATLWTVQYRTLLDKAEIECPPPNKPDKAKRGRIKRSKARNLLERLIDFEANVLCSMTHECVPFTNNMAENAIQVTKVHQKISGCFRSTEGAEIFCRVRGYLSTYRKQGECSSGNDTFV